VQTDPVSDISQKPLSSLDHARTLEAWLTVFPVFLSINSRSA
jgi:hypothetical protein